MTHTENIGLIDMQAIMQILPHRYPFLFVDRIVECVPGHFISGFKTVTNTESIFRAKPRNKRAMPHFLVVEALAQLSVVLAFKTLNFQPTGRELMFFAGIDKATFGCVAEPGETLLLRSEVSRIRKMMGWFEAQAEVRGQTVLKVSILAAIKAE